MQLIQKYNKPLFLILSLFFSTANVTASSQAQELYDEAMSLKHSSRYIESYNKLLEVEKLNITTDIAVRALYNLGWVAHKLTWYDRSAVHFFKSNEKNKELFNEDFQTAVNSLKTLRDMNKVSPETVFMDFATAHSVSDWTKEFIMGRNLSIIHTPKHTRMGFMTCGEGISMLSQSFNGFPLNPIGLHIDTDMSYQDFRNSIVASGLPITGER